MESGQVTACTICRGGFWVGGGCRTGGMLRDRVIKSCLKFMENHSLLIRIHLVLELGVRKLFQTTFETISVHVN